MAGFEIQKIGDSVSSVSFNCPECGNSASYLFRADIDRDRTFIGSRGSCCYKHKASDEVVFALDAAVESMRRHIAEQKLEQAKEGTKTYIAFGLVPLVLGVIFQSEAAIGFGMVTTIITAGIWFFGR